MNTLRFQTQYSVDVTPVALEIYGHWDHLLARTKRGKERDRNDFRGYQHPSVNQAQLLQTPVPILRRSPDDLAPEGEESEILVYCKVKMNSILFS